MTKAMSALVAFDLIAAGRLKESDWLTVRPETARRWAGKGTTFNLRGGERVRVSDLLLGMTTASANDAAIVLAEGAMGSTSAWVKAMNDRAQSLGMTASRFGTPNGFPDGGVTKVTAHDMAILAEALIVQHPQLYRRYIGRPFTEWRGSRLYNRDPLIGTVPGADGIKTGHTSPAGFTFLGSVQRDGRRLVLVIGKAPTEAARAAAARSLAEWGFTAWNSRPFLTADFVVGAAHIQGGDAREVPLAVPRSYSLAIPRGTLSRPLGRIIYRGPIRAPVAKGQIVARLVIEQPGSQPYELPLVATRPVGVAGPIDRLGNALLGLIS